MYKEIEIIRQTLPKSELLLQLAEEANELAIATMRLQNTFMINSHEDFIEEIADVKLCINVLGDYIDKEKIDSLEFDSYNNIYKSIIMESCQLSKAAIKLRRTIEPKASPTPVTKEDAEKILIYHINKLVAYLDIAGYWDLGRVMKVYKQKMIRWVDRLDVTKG